jgi:hypothetical protein
MLLPIGCFSRGFAILAMSKEGRCNATGAVYNHGMHLGRLIFYGWSERSAPGGWDVIRFDGRELGRVCV